jgi:hypothetical protein
MCGKAATRPSVVGRIFRQLGRIKNPTKVKADGHHIQRKSDQTNIEGLAVVNASPPYQALKRPHQTRGVKLIRNLNDGAYTHSTGRSAVTYIHHQNKSALLNY